MTEFVSIEQLKSLQRAFAETALNNRGDIAVGTSTGWEIVPPPDLGPFEAKTRQAADAAQAADFTSAIAAADALADMLDGKLRWLGPRKNRALERGGYAALTAEFKALKGLKRRATRAVKLLRRDARRAI